MAHHQGGTSLARARRAEALAPGSKKLRVAAAQNYRPNRSQSPHQLTLRKVGYGVLIIVSLLLGIWAALAWVTAARVPAGTSVSGVDISGMNHRDAATTLQRSLAGELTKPITVTAAGGETTLDPSKLGLVIDTDASLEGLTGFTFSPQTIFERLRGEHLQATTSLDENALRSALEEAVPQLSHGTQEASVQLNGTDIELAASTEGKQVDVDAAVAQLDGAWPLQAGSSATAVVALPEQVAQPEISDADADAFISSTLKPLLASPLTITYERSAFSISPEELAAMSTVSSSDGKLSLHLNADALRQKTIDSLGADIETAGKDAAWTVAGNAEAKPELVSATSGTEVDGETLSSNIVQAVSDGKHSVPLVFKPKDASVTDADAKSWGISEIVGEYATSFDTDAARDQNLTQGCAEINGDLVMPGQTFSMTEALGDIDEAHGFTKSNVIASGKYVEAMGGGLSQVTTTVFNAALEAGMDDVEHTPHSMYISNYPEGREATIWTGEIDMQFKNSTPSAALVQAWVAGGQVHVRLWSTPYYKVQIATSDRTNVVPYSTVTSTSAACVPNSVGEPAFDVTVTRQRTIIATGEALNKETWNVHYQANNVVKCL